MKQHPPTCDTPPADRRRLAGALDSAGSIDSVSLLGNRNEVEILHSGETYRLRRTRQGKLILTK